MTSNGVYGSQFLGTSRPLSQSTTENTDDDDRLINGQEVKENVHSMNHRLSFSPESVFTVKLSD